MPTKSSTIKSTTKRSTPKSKSKTTKTLSGAARRTKGAVAEREFIKLLESLLELPAGTLERNLQQWAKGGEDIINFPYFSIEIKKQSKANLNQWWKQALDQAQRFEPMKIPLLAYRLDRQRSWTVAVPAFWLVCGFSHKSFNPNQAVSLTSTPHSAPAYMELTTWGEIIRLTGHYFLIRSYFGVKDERDGSFEAISSNS